MLLQIAYFLSSPKEVTYFNNTYTLNFLKSRTTLTKTALCNRREHLIFERPYFQKRFSNLKVEEEDVLCMVLHKLLGRIKNL